MSILLPLYVYPTPGAWDPLYHAAGNHTDVDFTVIINPCSGPCFDSLPDQVYLNEIPKLRVYDNIRTLGYVATNYTDKAIDDVLSEVNIYANWPTITNNTKIKVDGIFFDETPSTFDAAKYQYLQTASQAVKNSTKFRDRFVVHNPGSVPSAILTSPTALSQTYTNLSDITVVFEETFDNWIAASNFDALHSSKIQPKKTAVILHSVPEIAQSVMQWVTDAISEKAAYMYVTSVGTDGMFYSSFGTLFDSLVKSLE